MNRYKALATVAQAVITFTLITQSDIIIPPLVKFLLGGISVALTNFDWGAFGDAKADDAE